MRLPKRLVAISRGSKAPGAVSCSCPTISESVCGRIRAARGWCAGALVGGRGEGEGGGSGSPKRSGWSTRGMKNLVRPLKHTIRKNQVRGNDCGNRTFTNVGARGRSQERRQKQKQE